MIESYEWTSKALEFICGFVFFMLSNMLQGIVMVLEFPFKILFLCFMMDDVFPAL